MTDSQFDTYRKISEREAEAFKVGRDGAENPPALLEGIAENLAAELNAQAALFARGGAGYALNSVRQEGLTVSFKSRAEGYEDEYQVAVQQNLEGQPYYNITARRSRDAGQSASGGPVYYQHGVSAFDDHFQPVRQFPLARDTGPDALAEFFRTAIDHVKPRDLARLEHTLQPPRPA